MTVYMQQVLLHRVSTCEAIVGQVRPDLLRYALCDW